MTTNNRPIRVLLADDHQLVASALAQLVNSFSGITVVAEANSADDLLRLLDKADADVVLVDSALLPTNKVTLPKKIVEAWPSVRLGVLAMFASNAYIQRLIDQGVSGFIHKDAAVSDFEALIRRIADGETVVYPGVALAAPETLSAGPGSAATPVEEPPLTARQTEILTLVARGYRTKGIAEHLGLSVKTVETHRADLMRRLGVRHMVGLIQEAIRRGLIPPT